MSKRILIVDDDRDFTECLAVRCRSLGLEVEVAHNALTAITIIGLGPPDLICLDVELPTVDGLSICEFCGSSPNTTQVPVIILTGRTDCATIERCGELHAFYMQKSRDLWTRLRPVITELVGYESILRFTDITKPKQPRFQELQQ